MQCCRRGAARSEGEVGKSYPEEMMLKVQLGKKGIPGRGNSMNKGEGSNTVLVEHDVQDRRGWQGPACSI